METSLTTLSRTALLAWMFLRPDLALAADFVVVQLSALWALPVSGLVL